MTAMAKSAKRHSAAKNVVAGKNPPYEVMTYDVITYDVIPYDLMTYMRSWHVMS